MPGRQVPGCGVVNLLPWRAVIGAPVRPQRWKVSESRVRRRGDSLSSPSQRRRYWSGMSAQPVRQRRSWPDPQHLDWVDPPRAGGAQAGPVIPELERVRELLRSSSCILSAPGRPVPRIHPRTAGAMSTTPYHRVTRNVRKNARGAALPVSAGDRKRSFEGASGPWLPLFWVCRSLLPAPDGRRVLRAGGVKDQGGSPAGVAGPVSVLDAAARMLSC